MFWSGNSYFPLTSSLQSSNFDSGCVATRCKAATVTEGRTCIRKQSCRLQAASGPEPWGSVQSSSPLLSFGQMRGAWRGLAVRSINVRSE